MDSQSISTVFYATPELRWSIGWALFVVIVCQLLVALLYLVLKLKNSLAIYAELCIMGMGVGTMIADSIMHLIPSAFGLHSDHHHHDNHETHDSGQADHEEAVFLGMSCLAGMVSVIVIEMVIHGIQHRHHHHHHPHQDTTRHRHDSSCLSLNCRVDACASRKDQQISESDTTGIVTGNFGVRRSGASRSRNGSGQSSDGSTNQGNGTECEPQPNTIELSTNPFTLQNGVKPKSSDGGYKGKHDEGKHRHHHKRDTEHLQQGGGCGDPGEHQHGGCGHSHGFSHLFRDDENVEDTMPMIPHSDSRIKPDESQETTIPRKSRLLAAAVTNIAAQSVHNIVDGVTLAIAFKGGWSAGIATMIAIVTHEIPMQFTDFVITRRGGFTFCRAFLINFGVALFLVVGTFFAAIGMSQGLRAHLLMATAGNFLALAFLNIVPALKDEIDGRSKNRSSTPYVACVCVSGLIGVAIITILGIFEQH